MRSVVQKEFDRSFITRKSVADRMADVLGRHLDYNAKVLDVPGFHEFSTDLLRSQDYVAAP